MVKRTTKEQAEQFWQQELRPFLKRQGAFDRKDIKAQEYFRDASPIYRIPPEIEFRRPGAFFDITQKGKNTDSEKDSEKVGYYNYFSLNSHYLNAPFSEYGIEIVLSDDTVQLRHHVSGGYSPHPDFHKEFELFQSGRLSPDYNVIFRHRLDGRRAGPHWYSGILKYKGQRLLGRAHGRGDALVADVLRSFLYEGKCSKTIFSQTNCERGIEELTKKERQGRY